MIFCNDDIELIKKIVKLLNQKKVNWWIDQGTLLGFEREGKPLEWDTDFDIGTTATPDQLISEILCEIKSKGIKAYFDDSCDALKIISENKTWSIDIACYVIDQNFCKKYWPNFSEFTKFQLIIFTVIIFLSDGTQKINRTVPRIIFKSFEFLAKPLKILLNRNLRRRFNLWLKKYIPLKENKVESMYFERLKYYKYGEISLKAPELVQEYLEKRYGSRWRWPNKNWNYLINDGGLSL